MNDTVSNNEPDPMTFITEGVADAGVYLAMWDARDEQPTAAQLAAAIQAVERIDVTLQRLQRVRSSIATELQHAADETMRRTEEMLKRLRPERQADDNPPSDDVHDPRD